MSSAELLAELLTGTPVVEPVLDTAAAAHATLVNRARAALLRSGTAITVSQLAEATGRNDDTARRWVARKRDANRLVTVTLHDGTLLIPTVQLDEAFDLDEEVVDRTQRLIEYGMGPWAIWDWWQTPNGWLGGDVPADAAEAGDFHGLDRAIDGLMQ